MGQLEVLKTSIFLDRRDGGRQLAAKLQHYAHRAGVLVLGLPRGGVPVAYEVALALGAPLDVFVVRKLGVPDREEFAMGAVATGGIQVFNEDVIRDLRIPRWKVEEVITRELAELARRERVFRGDRPPASVRGRTVIIVDDGLATGASMLAAIAALRRQLPERIVAAVPIAPRETCDDLTREVDEVVCAERPEPFYGVGQWYRDFAQTTDEEVHALLDAAAVTTVSRMPASPPR